MIKNTLIILIAGLGSVIAMEQPQARILYRQPKSLKEIAYLKSVKNIKSIAEFNKLIAVTPADLHCDLVKNIIHNKNLTQQEVIELINKYCRANSLFKAYTYYTRITRANRDQNIMKMRALRQAAQLQQDHNASTLITEFIVLASIPENDFTLLKLLINRNDLSQIQQVISLGEQPTIHDLGDAIAGNRNRIVQILIDAHVPLQDEQLFITDQPLHVAFYTLNETAVATLIAHGVSPTQQYLITNGSKEKDSIANDILTRIQNWDYSRPLTDMNVEQTKEYFKKLHALLNKYVPQKSELKRKSF